MVKNTLNNEPVGVVAFINRKFLHRSGFRHYHCSKYKCFTGKCYRLQAHERLEEVKLQAVRNNNVQLVLEVLDSLNSLSGKDAAAAELARILQEPHFKVSLSLSSDFTPT